MVKNSSPFFGSCYVRSSRRETDGVLCNLTTKDTCLSFILRRKADIKKKGSMAEWLKAMLLKSIIAKTIASSNLARPYVCKLFPISFSCSMTGENVDMSN